MKLLMLFEKRFCSNPCYERLEEQNCFINFKKFKLDNPLNIVFMLLIYHNTAVINIDFIPSQLILETTQIWTINEGILLSYFINHFACSRFIYIYGISSNKVKEYIVKTKAHSQTRCPDLHSENTDKIFLWFLKKMCYLP